MSGGYIVVTDAGRDSAAFVYNSETQALSWLGYYAVLGDASERARVEQWCLDDDLDALAQFILERSGGRRSEYHDELRRSLAAAVEVANGASH